MPFRDSTFCLLCCPPSPCCEVADGTEVTAVSGNSLTQHGAAPCFYHGIPTIVLLYMEAWEILIHLLVSPAGDNLVSLWYQLRLPLPRKESCGKCFLLPFQCQDISDWTVSTSSSFRVSFWYQTPHHDKIFLQPLRTYYNELTIPPSSALTHHLVVSWYKTFFPSGHRSLTVQMPCVHSIKISDYFSHFPVYLGNLI